MFSNFCPPLRYRRASKRKNFPNHESIITVIIGAGVIGLSTAYQLGRAIDKRGIRGHKVIVLEVAADVFPASSSTNTGILSYGGFRDGLGDLGEFSFKLWEKLGTDTKFKKTCGYTEERNVAVRSDSEEGHHLLPSWFQAKPEYVPYYPFEPISRQEVDRLDLKSRIIWLN